MVDINNLFQEIVELGYLEDRREYDRELLKDAYGLTDDEAEALYQRIQSEFN